MSDFKWDDYAQAKSDDFDWDQFEPTKPLPKTTQLESGLRGLAQGASMGFVDELTGGLESAAGSLGLVPDKTYEQARDESRANYLRAQTDNPLTYGAGQVGGGLATLAIPGLNVAKGASLARTAGTAALQGGLTGLGSSEKDDLKGMAWDAAKGGALGGALGYAGGKLASELSSATPKVADALTKKAEDLAVKATGATGVQSAKFADDAGRQLLDRGLVRFGDTAKKVAERTQTAMDEAGESIGRSLKDLEAKGVTASVDDVVYAIENKIADLKRFPGNDRLINQLQNEADNLVARGQSELPIGVAEQAKRNFQRQVNWNSPAFEQDAATTVSRAFKDEVEKKALAASPELGKEFKESKDLFSLLSPINVAAEKRAKTLNQSPFGGLLDMASTAAGGAVGGPPAALAAAPVRAFASKRLASSGAVSLDKLGEILKAAPENFGRYGRVLQNAATRGATSLGATNFVLMNTDPEYRKMLLEMSKEQ